MKTGDLVRFSHPYYSRSEVVGIIIDSKPLELGYLGKNETGTTYTVLEFSGKISRIHSTVWPECEVISEGR